MIRIISISLVLLCIATLFSTFTLPLTAEEHGHAEAVVESIKPPRIFYNKSPRIIAYQLKRLDNRRLLLIERNADDPKYKPVFEAILKREGISRKFRDDALASLVKINKSDPVEELMSVLDSLDAEKKADVRVSKQLTTLLLQQAAASLEKSVPALEQATHSENSLLRTVGFAGLLAAKQNATAIKLANKNANNKLAFLSAIPALPDAKLRNALQNEIVNFLKPSHPNHVRRAALTAVGSLTENRIKNFEMVSQFATNPKFQKAAINALLKNLAGNQSPEVAKTLSKYLVEYAEKTPAAKRTSDHFINAMQLADKLFPLLPNDTATVYRDRLSKVTVRVVVIKTVMEEMRYDVPFFAVEAGHPVQLILKNDDMMPHNLVVTAPKALKEVANAGAGLPAGEGPDPKIHVPNSDKVLHVIDMLQGGQQGRITFTAPTTPGEYPYVCTFPRHWMRMYGVMVVVKDLDAWQKKPVEPKDPIGSNRRFVKKWTTNHFKDKLDEQLRGRTPLIGKKLFKEATCALCHKMQGEGGAVGPELTDVLQRRKGDKMGVLREILDPSHKVDPKFAMYTVITLQGKPITGLMQSQDKKSISLITNPEAKKVTVIQRDDILQMQKSDLSMMPKALLDKYTADEVLEILNYILATKKK